MISSKNVVTEIGNACSIEIGSRWWERLRNICDKYGMNDLGNLISLRDISVEGLEVQKVGRRIWKESIGMKERMRVCTNEGGTRE